MKIIYVKFMPVDYLLFLLLSPFWLIHSPFALTLSGGVYKSWFGEERCFCFCSNWMRWAEQSQSPHHLLLSGAQEDEGGAGGQELQREGKMSKRELSPPTSRDSD